ncbi:MAG TPA: LLM class flavin-dependent oxidoreductase [Candidatus Acidoferrum sp.]|nr:LLM class flavin-dependent oxidoreductase [Candidatus Acidoferrum sp.]
MTSLTFGFANVAVDPLTAVEYGVLAEKSGFDTLWMPDHIVDVDGDKTDPWTTLSAVAVRTKKIRLGSAVTDTQRSHPSRTAHQVASLDQLSHGRAILGIGAGEAMNIVPFGLPWDQPQDRITRLAEAITVIRLLWSSTREKPVSYEGRFYNLENAFLSQPPKKKPHPPIYVGVFSSKSALKVVGELGDGWYSWLNTADTFKRRWAVIGEAAKNAGRSRRMIVPCSHLLVAFPKNTRERKMAMMSAKMTLIMEKSVLKSLGYKPAMEQYQNLGTLKEDVAKVLSAAELVPDDLVHRVCSIGDMDQVEEKVEQLAKAGITHFSIADLLAPLTVKRTLKKMRRTISRYA